MNRKRLGIAAILLVAAALAWFGWRRATAPAAPTLDLAGVDPEVRALVESRLAEARAQPRSGEAWGQLGMALRAHNFRSSEEEACFLQARNRDPANPRWPYYLALRCLLGNPEKALPYFREALDRCPRSSPGYGPMCCRWAETLVELGRLDEAEKVYAIFAEAEPTHPRLRYGRGLLACARGDFADAKEHFLAVRSVPFVHQRVCQHLASVSLQLGDAASAQLYQESAARALPDLAWPDPLLAEILELEVGRQPRMARAEKAEAAGRFDEAAQLLRELVAKAPTPANQVILGIMLVRAKRYAEAEPVLESTLRLEPANLQAHYYLAVSRFFRAEKLPPDSNDAKELYRLAVESADKVVELKADHAYGYVFRGQALRRLGRKAEGLAELRWAAQIRGEMADVHRQLANALIEDGAIEEGTRSLETVLRLEPGDAGSRALLEKHRRPK